MLFSARRFSVAPRSSATASLVVEVVEPCSWLISVAPGSSATASRGVMKPDIVFFKEALPKDFFASLRSDLESVVSLEEHQYCSWKSISIAVGRVSVLQLEEYQYCSWKSISGDLQGGAAERLLCVTAE